MTLTKLNLGSEEQALHNSYNTSDRWIAPYWGDMLWLNMGWVEDVTWYQY